MANNLDWCKTKLEIAPFVEVMDAGVGVGWIADLGGAVQPFLC